VELFNITEGVHNGHDKMRKMRLKHCEAGDVQLMQAPGVQEMQEDRQEGQQEGHKADDDVQGLLDQPGKEEVVQEVHCAAGNVRGADGEVRPEAKIWGKAQLWRRAKAANGSQSKDLYPYFYCLVPYFPFLAGCAFRIIQLL
jgi:hypothetical protein